MGQERRRLRSRGGGDRQEAIRLYTSAAARYSFSENKTGSIEPRKLADLAILSDDPLTVSEDALKNITVLRTIVGGRTVFESAAPRQL